MNEIKKVDKGKGVRPAPEPRIPSTMKPAPDKCAPLSDSSGIGGGSRETRETEEMRFKIGDGKKLAEQIRTCMVGFLVIEDYASELGIKEKEFGSQLNYKLAGIFLEKIKSLRTESQPYTELIEALEKVILRGVFYDVMGTLLFGQPGELRLNPDGVDHIRSALEAGRKVFFCTSSSSAYEDLLDAGFPKDLLDRVQIIGKECLRFKVLEEYYDDEPYGGIYAKKFSYRIPPKSS
ncbi:MAG: hypothetical protein NT157_05015 [Candidatus Micrarchaeota archaeon]|nr:hypothetical protein [Candidatus Micrarchaeota archaeon]